MLPSPEEAASGAVLENPDEGVFVFKETGAGELEPVMHTFSTTIDEIASKVQIEDAQAIVVDTPAGASRERVKVGVEQITSENGGQAQPAGIEDVRASAESATYKMLVEQLQNAQARSERLQEKIDQLHEQHREEVSRLEDEHRAEVEELRQKIESLRQERRDLRSDMSATERIAQQAAPKMPQILTALAQRLQAPSREVRVPQNGQQQEAPMQARPTGEREESLPKGGSSGNEAEETEDLSPEQEEIVQQEVERRMMLQQAVGTLSAFVQEQVTEDQLMGHLQKLDEQIGLPSDVSRLMEVGKLFRDNIHDYVEQLESLSPEQAAELLAEGAEGEVSDEEMEMLTLLIDNLQR